MPRRVERYLPYVPLPNSEHVYVNGIEQRIGTDYTIENTSHVVIPAAAEVGDKVEVLYAHIGEAGAPIPAFNDFVTPTQSGSCSGPMTWENAHDYTDWTFTPSNGDLDWDRPLESGEVFSMTSTMASIAYRFAGVAGFAVYLDGWLYFRHPDGCIRSFNYITGNVSKNGHGPHNTNYTIPVALNMNGHSIPVGSRLVAWSMNNYDAGGQRIIRTRN